MKENKELFIRFDSRKDRLDVFFWSLVGPLPKFDNLKKLLKIILIVSHEQAQVGRGFSVNEKLLLDNLRAESLIAQRLIHDYMTSLNTTSHDYMHNLV